MARIPQCEACIPTLDAALEESLALRAHALEQAQFGIIVTDPATRHITTVNAAYARLVGYEPHELIGTTGHQLIPEDSRALVGELQPRGSYTVELRLRRKDGTTVPVLASSSTVEMPSGSVMRIATVIDMSAREQLEEVRAGATLALERSAARLEILAATAHELASASGSIEIVLELAARRLGEILGDSCAVRLISADGAWLDPTSSLYHPDPELREVARQVLGSERQPIGEGIAGQVAATGERALLPVIDLAQLAALTAPAFRPMLERIGVASVLVVPLRSRGRTIGVIGLLRSRPGNPYTVEDQHLAQELADRAGLAIDNAVLVATLEHRVTERTAALEAVNRDLEAFSYSVSHDLRTPLRAIDSFSRILLADHADELDERAQHYLQRIGASTQRMSGLIDDLLDLARITRRPIHTSQVDVSALADEVVAEIRRREPGRAIAIHVTPGMTARADPRLLRIVLENLLGNAWKFTANHPGAAIWCGVDAAGFFVRDTGAGFDMAYADKLFVPFQRLHAGHDYEGSGVGLATVCRIVNHHGGRIWAEARLEEGATFWFTLGG